METSCRKPLVRVPQCHASVLELQWHPTVLCSCACATTYGITADSVVGTKSWKTPTLVRGSVSRISRSRRFAWPPDGECSCPRANGRRQEPRRQPRGGVKERALQRKGAKVLAEALGRICYMLPLPGIQVPGVGGSGALQVHEAGALRNHAEARR